MIALSKHNPQGWIVKSKNLPDPVVITQAQAIEYIKILLAYIEGKQLQAKTRDGDWHTCQWHSFFHFGEITYRVKPEKKTFTLTDEAGRSIKVTSEAE